MYALVNPVLALGLLAVAGLLAARLPRPSSTRPPSLDLALTAGAPLVLLGLVLGPGIELLARPLWRALAPLTAFAIGWIGAALGARFERRGAPPGTRPEPRRRARDGSRRARDGRPAGPTSSRGVDRIRRERRGSGRMGVLERDAPRPRGPGSHGAARRQRAARRGSRLCD